MAETASDIIAAAEDFAAVKILPQNAILLRSKAFPADLWQDLADAGFLAMGLPETYGGSNLDYRDLAGVARALNRIGGVPGVTMTWLCHNLICKLHMAPNAPKVLRKDLLGGAGRGEHSFAMAISEPGAGAHPKLLQTTARLVGGKFILNGEKAYLTNGPLADYFITLAITGENNGRKQFSAILVPRDAPGFAQTAGVEVDFLHPSPHCGIQLIDCEVPAGYLIGEAGKGFENTSLVMRAFEDVLAASALIGSLEYLMGKITRHLPAETAEDGTGRIGALHTRILTLAHLADSMAGQLDQAETGPDRDNLLSLHLGFRQLADPVVAEMQALAEQSKLDGAEDLRLTYRDVQKGLAIAQRAHEARLAKIGSQLLKEMTHS